MIPFRIVASSESKFSDNFSQSRESDVVWQNEYMEEHRKRHGRRFDHEERKSVLVYIRIRTEFI